MDRIIFIDPVTGSLRVIAPSPHILEFFTIQEVAEKDVPAGVPFQIVPLSDIPTDRTERQAWTVDPATLVDGVGADRDEFLPLPEPAPEV